jgi:hypothetical protein
MRRTLVLCTLWLTLAAPAWAQFTPAQITAIQAAITADPALSAIPNTYPDGATQLAAAFNAPASPAFTVWKTSVTQDAIMAGMDWTRVDNLSVGKARIWDWMFSNQSRTINPSKTSIRTGIEAVWVGTAADLAVRATVYAQCKRVATYLEQVLATGTGSDADPATLTFEGAVNPAQIHNARNAGQ